MRRVLLTVILPVLAMVCCGTDRQNPARLFKAAMNTEVVDGELKSAITQYEKVVQGPDRTLAAQALIRMAGSYRLLGSKESTKAFQRVISEYGDQKEAVRVARAELNGAGRDRPEVMSLTKLWDIRQDGFSGGPISPDGRFMFHVDWSTGDLAVHEFATGLDRRLTNKGDWSQSAEYAEQLALSRDGTRLAYSWFNGTGYEVRLADVQSGAIAQPRKLFHSEGVSWIGPSDWSADGKRIAVTWSRPKQQGVQVGWLSVDDGAVHALRSDLPGNTGQLLFSPDGKHMAIDVNVDETGERHDLALLTGDGRLVRFENAGRDELVAWAPDGKSLLFTNDQRGATGLWAVTVTDGNMQGPPRLIKQDIGQITSFGLTAAGSLYYGAFFQGQSVYTASVDFNSGKLLSPASWLAQPPATNRWSDWSRDGRSLVYKSERRPGRYSLAVYSDETGRVVRELWPTLPQLMAVPRWAPDGQSILARGVDTKGRQGIFRIDAQTGEVTPILFDSSAGSPEPSRDGTKIYYVKQQTGPLRALVEFDLVSRKEREILRRDSLGPPVVSPDGLTIVAGVQDTATKSASALAIDIATGTVRELIRVSQPQWFGNVTWTHDGRRVLARKNLDASGGPFEVLLIPVSGGQPTRLDLGMPNVTPTPLRAHPDGRRITFGAGQSRGFREVWVLENFLPQGSEPIVR